jgi:hypothetical protein
MTQPMPAGAPGIAAGIGWVIVCSGMVGFPLTGGPEVGPWFANPLWRSV